LAGGAIQLQYDDSSSVWRVIGSAAGSGGGSGVTTVGALNGGTANATGATITGTTIYLQEASTSWPGLVTASAQSLAGDKTFTGELKVGDATNYVKLNSDFSVNGRIFGGTGRPTRQIKLIPEFSGAIFHADGSNNTGFMTSDYVSGVAGDKHNYYEWTSDQATAQDYDIVVQYQLPSDFDGFVASSFKFWTYVDTTTSTNAQVMIEDVDGTDCYTGQQSVKPGSATTWTQTTIADPANGCTFAANDIITITIKPAALTPTTNTVRIGEFQFDYKAKF
jgi:hypothetical protein